MSGAKIAEVSVTVSADEIAAAVARRLRYEHWVSGTIPPEIAEWIKAKTNGKTRQQVNLLYLEGSDAITEQWTIAASGALSLELRDVNGWVFWRGTLEPIAKEIK